MSYEPFFSLILATLNRPTEVQICLKSLSQQTFRNFEIIIIDQSNNNDTEVSYYGDLRRQAEPMR